MSTLTTVLPRAAARLADRDIEAAIREALSAVGGSPGDPAARAMMGNSISPVVDEYRHALARRQLDYLEAVYLDAGTADVTPEPYQSIAVTKVLTASWYTQTARYSDVEDMHPLDRLELEYLPGGISEDLTDEAIARFISRAAAQLGQHVRNAPREAVMGAARKRGDSWQRVMVGETCPFCAILVSRGAVYSSQSVKFRSHPHCDCGAAVVKRGRDGESIIAGKQEAENAAELRDKWDRLYREAGSSKAAAREFGKWYRGQTV